MDIAIIVINKTTDVIKSEKNHDNDKNYNRSLGLPPIANLGRELGS